jgi:nitroreductase
MTSNPVIDNIYARRSVRTYDNKAVPDETIKELIKAGFHAANGLNAQKLRFSVVTNKAKLKEYSDKAKIIFLEFMKSSGMVNEYLEGNMKNPDFNIFYDAPAAIFIYAAPGILSAKEDASLAAANIMLAARSMNIGTCWIGFAAGLGSDKGFMAENNIPEDHKLQAGLILGYPKNGFPKPSERSEVQILGWVR